MAQGLLPAELRDSLPADVRDAYDLDYLFAGEVNGVLRWIVVTLGEVWYGPVIGPAFSDTVLSLWARLDPNQYIPPIA